MFQLKTKLFRENKTIYFNENTDQSVNATEIQSQDSSFLKRYFSNNVQKDINIDKRKNFDFLVNNYGFLRIIINGLLKIQLLTQYGNRIDLDNISDDKKEIISIINKEYNFLPIEKYKYYYKDDHKITLATTSRKYKKYILTYDFKIDKQGLNSITRKVKMSVGKTAERNITFFKNGHVQSDQSQYSVSTPKEISKSIEIYSETGYLLSKTNEYANNNKYSPLPDSPTLEIFNYKNGKLLQQIKEYGMSAEENDVIKIIQNIYEDTGTTKSLTKQYNIKNDNINSVSKKTKYYNKTGELIGIEKKFGNAKKENDITRKIEIFGKNQVTTIKKIELRDNAKQKDLWTEKIQFFSQSGILTRAIVRIFGNKRIVFNRATIEHFSDDGNSDGNCVRYDPKKPENKEFQVDITK